MHRFWFPTATIPGIALGDSFVVTYNDKGEIMIEKAKTKKQPFYRSCYCEKITKDLWHCRLSDRLDKYHYVVGSGRTADLAIADLQRQIRRQKQRK